jgi:ABC-type transporter Mla maintaining outer membrane lipid asymmetry permease subunit MlaE
MLKLLLAGVATAVDAVIATAVAVFAGVATAAGIAGVAAAVTAAVGSSFLKQVFANAI